MNTNPNRHPAGTKKGGRFAPGDRADDMRLIHIPTPVYDFNHLDRTGNNERSLIVNGPWNVYDVPTSCRSFLLWGVDEELVDVMRTPGVLRGIKRRLGFVSPWDDKHGFLSDRSVDLSAMPSTWQRVQEPVNLGKELSPDHVKKYLGCEDDVVLYVHALWVRRDIASGQAHKPWSMPHLSQYGRALNSIPVDFVIVGEQHEIPPSERIQSSADSFQKVEGEQLKGLCSESYDHHTELLSVGQFKNMASYSSIPQINHHAHWVRLRQDALERNFLEASKKREFEFDLASHKDAQPSIGKPVSPIAGVKFCVDNSLGSMSRDDAVSHITEMGGTVVSEPTYADINLGKESDTVYHSNLPEAQWLEMLGCAVSASEFAETEKITIPR